MDVNSAPKGYPPVQKKSLAWRSPSSSPGFEGRFAPGVRKVDDPYEPGAKRDVIVNLRHDVLLGWHARKSIDDAEFSAGRWFQAIFDRAQIGTLGAIRYDKPKVDGGYPVDPMTEKVLQAQDDLSEIAAVLGIIDYPLMCRIVGQGVTPEIEAKSGHWGSDRPERYVRRRVRDALKTLAEKRASRAAKSLIWMT